MNELHNQIDEFVVRAETLKDQDRSAPAFSLWKNSVSRFVEDNYGQAHRDIFNNCFSYRTLTGGSHQRQVNHEMYLSKAINFLNALKNESPKTQNQKDVAMDHDAIKDRILEWMFEYQKDHPTVEPTAHHIASKLSNFRREDVISSVFYLSGVKLLIKHSVKGNDHFRLSSKAIDNFQPSKYKSDSASRVQIKANNSIVIMGDNLGSVEQHNAEGIAELDLLIEKILTAAQISQEDKLNAVADAETIKSQLLKPKPNLTIIQAAWFTVNAAAAMAGADDFAMKVTHLLGIH